MKTHLKITGVDCRDSGQRQWEYDHQTACGYTRRNVTRNGADVNCFYCLRSKEMEQARYLVKVVKAARDAIKPTIQSVEGK